MRVPWPVPSCVSHDLVAEETLGDSELLGVRPNTEISDKLCCEALCSLGGTCVVHCWPLGL